LEQHKRFAQQLDERQRGDDEAHQMDEDYVRRTGVWIASNRRRGHRHRPSGDAADRLQVDSRRDSVSIDETRKKQLSAF